MILNSEDMSKARNLLWASLLALGCFLMLGFAAERANAFTQTIEDIEDPAVTAKVLSLEVQATQGWSDTNYCNHTFCHDSLVLSSVSAQYALEGGTDGSLTEEQFPKVVIDENTPARVKIVGDLVTEKAEGSENYHDFLGCTGNRETTASARLSVSLSHLYQSGSSTYEGLPGISIATQNLDPWFATCVPLSGYPNADTSSRVTKIEAFPTPGPISTMTPENGCAPEYCVFSTTKDICTPDYCDFTISAVNGYTSGVTSSFTLSLRLQYTADEEAGNKKTSAAPETRITKAPRKLIRTRGKSSRVTFRFKSTGPKGTKFMCRLDRRKFQRCSSTFKRRVRLGKHRFAVKSVYKGKADNTPAVYTWRVKKVGRSR